jgi:Domain of unknown function (DUF4129)
MAKRHSTRTPRVTARIAPSWLAAIGLVLSVTSMWPPRMPGSADVGQRLALNVPAGILVGLAAAAVAMSLAIVSVLLRAPRRTDPDEFIPQPSRPPRRSAATFLALLLPLVVSIAGGAVALHLLDVTSLSPASSLWVPGTESTDTPTRAMIDVPIFDFALTLTLGGAIAVITAFAVLAVVLNQPWTAAAGWLSRSRGRKNSTLVAGLTSAMSTGIHELEVGDDPRSAVIACYRRCEAALASHRRRRYASETAREFVHEALAALKLPALAIRSLLQVFEKARFSELPVTSSDRSAALSALEEIRSALERRFEDGAQS